MYSEEKLLASYLKEACKAFNDPILTVLTVSCIECIIITCALSLHVNS